MKSAMVPQGSDCPEAAGTPIMTGTLSQCSPLPFWTSLSQAQSHSGHLPSHSLEVTELTMFLTPAPPALSTVALPSPQITMLVD